MAEFSGSAEFAGGISRLCAGGSAVFFSAPKYCQLFRSRTAAPLCWAAVRLSPHLPALSTKKNSYFGASKKKVILWRPSTVSCSAAVPQPRSAGQQYVCLHICQHLAPKKKGFFYLHARPPRTTAKSPLRTLPNH